MKTASAKFQDARISIKHSVVICKELKGKSLKKAKALLEGLLDESRDIDGKHFSSAAKKFLEILENAEANAKQKNLNLDKLFVKKAKADAGETFVRPKSRWKLRGRKAKSSTIIIEVEER